MHAFATFRQSVIRGRLQLAASGSILHGSVCLETSSCVPVIRCHLCYFNYLIYEAHCLRSLRIAPFRGSSGCRAGRRQQSAALMNSSVRTRPLPTTYCTVPYPNRPAAISLSHRGHGTAEGDGGDVLPRTNPQPQREHYHRSGVQHRVRFRRLAEHRSILTTVMSTLRAVDNNHESIKKVSQNNKNENSRRYQNTHVLYKYVYIQF